MLKLLYYKFVMFGMRKPHILFINTTITAVSLYFVVQKLSGWSITHFLIYTGAFSAGGVMFVKVLLLIVIIYCAISKILIMIVDTYPITKTQSYNLVDLAFCAFSINNEIERHYGKLRDKANKGKRSLIDAHAFDQNLALVVKTFYDHIKKSFPSIPLNNSDILISVYKIPNFESLPRSYDRLECVTYYNSAIEGQMNSREILLNDPKYRDYECVKCIANKKDSTILYSCENYAKLGSERQKTVKHYAGWRLDWNNHPIGFINVEFHNHKHDYFYDKQSYEKFIDEHVLVFKHLIKYQFMKRMFFSRLQSLYPIK